MISRMIRALRLDASLYNEVERQPSLNQEALIVVAIVAAINGGLFGLLFAVFGRGVDAISAIVAYIIGTLIGYLIATFVVAFIGTRFFGATTNWEEARRTIGYAYTPMILTGLPCIGFVFVLLTLVTIFQAVRETLDLNSGQTLIVVILTWVALIIIYALLNFAFPVIDLSGIGIS